MKSIFKLLHASLLILVIYSIPHCFESEDDTLLRLSKTISQVGQTSHKLDKAKKEITKLLMETNQGYSTLTAKANSRRVIKLNLTAQDLFWVQSGRFYYFENGNSYYFDIRTDRRVTKINTSWEGNYAIVLLEGQVRCTPKIVAIDEKRLMSRQLPTLPKKECDHVPTISDDGILYFYVSGRELKQISFKSNRFNERTLYKFPSKDMKYKKINNRFVLHQVKKKGIAIFWGNAGYYRLYYYNGVNGKIKLHPKAFSSSRLFSARGNWEYKRTFPIHKKDFSIKQKTTPKIQLGLYKADAYAYSGGAGKLKLHALRFEEKLIVQSGFPIKTMTNLFFLREQGRFLVLQRQRLYYWDPITNDKKRLPLSAKQIYLFKDGLVYMDIFNRLYFRSNPFSHFEISLLDLYQEISLIEK